MSQNLRKETKEQKIEVKKKKLERMAKYQLFKEEKA
jgi:hypothetical protein